MKAVKKHGDVFIVWHPFQQRAQMLSIRLGASPCWFSYPWEKKSTLAKGVAYLVKAFATLALCIKIRPRRIFVQLPPVPLLYTIQLYRWLASCQVIYDCHNSLFCSHWIRWPLVRRLLQAKGVVTLTHNEDIAVIAEGHGVRSQVLLDPLPHYAMPENDVALPAGLRKHGYVIVPFSFSDDEPVEELLAAARRLPDMTFVITWFKDRAQRKTASAIPDNIVFTGFLALDVYQAVFANALCALALTTREGTQPSVATEAIGFGVPLLVSDLNTTRKLYDRWPIYVDNGAQSIAEAIQIVDQSRDDIVSRMQQLHARIERMQARQLAALASALTLRAD